MQVAYAGDGTIRHVLVSRGGKTAPGAGFILDSPPTITAFGGVGALPTKVSTYVGYETKLTAVATACVVAQASSPRGRGTF